MGLLVFFVFLVFPGFLGFLGFLGSCFSLGNIVFEVLVRLTFQKYITSWVFWFFLFFFCFSWFSLFSRFSRFSRFFRFLFFSLGNIVFEVLVRFLFQKYITSWVFSGFSHSRAISGLDWVWDGLGSLCGAIV